MAQLRDSVIAGNLRVTDEVLADTVQARIVSAPTTSGGTSYGPGTNGQVLKSNGTSAYWAEDENQTYSVATTSANGLMSSTDKAKLDAMNGINVYYVEGSANDTAGVWTGTIDGLTAYYDGLTILYRPKVAGSSDGTTLNINELGAKTCYTTNSSALTTHYNTYAVILFTYSNNYWRRADYDSNTNTLLRVYTQNSGYNDDYPVLVGRTDADTLTAKSNDEYTGVYGVIYKTNAPTLNPSTGLLKVKDITVSDTITGKVINNLVTGTGTAGQAGSSSAAYVPTLWTFDLGFTPKAGDTLTIKIPVAGVNSGVWMSVDNGSHYYPVAAVNKTRLSTQFPLNEIITLTYETDMTTTIYGTSTSGAAAGAATADYESDRWIVKNYYDTNTTYSVMSTAEVTAGTASTSRVIQARYLSAGLKAAIVAGSKTGQLSVYGQNVNILPAVTASDNGKFLQVVSGEWAAVSVANANGVSF